MSRSLPIPDCGASDPAADGGVGDATLHAADLGAFKSPSLRNVEVTAPYGHDGRFATLDALIDHYSDNPISDPHLGYANSVGPLKFTASEKVALIAFLRTLTDRACLTDPKFSNPFVNRNGVVRTVTRTMRTAGAMLMGVATTAAHAPVALRSAVLMTEMPPVPPPPPERFPDAVSRRLVSFDANGDRRVSRDELPERMQGLAARGDKNADAALDPDEIRALVNAASSGRPHVSFRSQSSEGLPGVIKDLKLPPAKHALALAILSPHRLPRSVNDRANSDLYGAMRALLDDEEYESFMAAATRLSRRPHIIK